MENEVDFKALATSNEESLKFIAKEMGFLARRLNKTPFTEERMDQYKSNLIEASFFLNSYAIGARAFNKMVAEKQEKPDCERGLVDYFMDEVVKLQANEMSEEQAAKDE